ncbi:High affinity immunoglobulin gamma Fc receptor I [Channa argus]|nr:High affinity immunoglobulin gamma Fc receptor I [Channa argus]
MEVTAHRFRLVILLIILLSGRVHTSAFHIVPNKLQLFQYESVSFHCEGLDGSTQLRGIRNTEGFLSVCDSNKTTTLFCTIDRAYQADSGEYWCETKGGKRSNNVSITVTAGSVVLNSPVLPVIEGDNVTLRCSNKNLSSLTAYFYKDERLIRTSITGNMTIHSVSRSHEGFYKCASGTEESPVNPLTVRGGDLILESPHLPVTEGEIITLRCTIKTLSIKFPAVFYKDSVFIGTSSTGNLTIHSVYKHHEGLYTCNIFGVGESAGSWLTVIARHRDVCPCSDPLLCVVLLLRTVFTIVMVPLLLLLVGLLHCGKRGAPQSISQINAHIKTTGDS